MDYGRLWNAVAVVVKQHALVLGVAAQRRRHLRWQRK